MQLSTHDLVARYGQAQALFGIDFQVAEGETVAIIGANGAGKSTFLKSVCGQLAVARDAVRLDGQGIGGIGAADVVRLGVAMVPEGRRLFRSLSVDENLRTGLFARRPGPWNLERVYALFPVLREKRHQPGTSLSGGQQQMVAIGRALMSNPKLLLCDELSLGLAPTVVKDIYGALPSLCAEGMAIVIVEQDIDLAQRTASRLYCFMHGRVTLAGASCELTKHQIAAAYFGLEEAAS